MDLNQLIDLMAGCLYGGALGDALGYTVEFDSWETIRERYGKAGIRDLFLTNGKARVSDDTQMTLFTAEGMNLGILHAGEQGSCELIERSVYQAYLCWLQTQGYSVKSRWDADSRLLRNPDMHHCRAPGNTCLSALCSGKMGTIAEPINHSKGCGGVMRTAPLGFLREPSSLRAPFGEPLLLGARCAAITHGHPMGWIPAGMLSDMVDRCLYGSYASLRELILASLAATIETFSAPPYGLDPEMLRDFQALMLRAVELAGEPGASPIWEEDEAKIRSLGQGWVGDEALAIAVYAALRHPNDLRAALIAAVNHSGDSDSTGAITGNLLGAWLGRSAIPQDWLCQLELCNEIETILETRRHAMSL